MAASPAPLESSFADFALIGHFDRWESATSILNSFPAHEPLGRDDIASLLPWIPPRALFHVTARSTRGHSVSGVYIDCFISPDELDASFTRRNLQRVRAAASAASRNGSRIATLGGFSSILLEGDTALFDGGQTVFTTGNTLTAAFIIAGVKAALAECGRELETQRVLIIGSTGDIGSACASYLSPLAGGMLLVARNRQRLGRQLDSLRNANARASTEIDEFLPDADVVLSVASTPGRTLDLRNARADAIICDAGYPLNVRRFPVGCVLAFHGGMGELVAGYEIDPPTADLWRKSPGHAVGHGCLLEAMLLALEGRFESFSAGRGCITPQRIDEISAIAARHGFVVAPLSETRIAMEAER